MTNRGVQACAMRKFYDGPAEGKGDVCLHARYFTYRSDAGLVAGADFNVMFTIDRPAVQAWPYIKDFNLWQNAFDHYYSGVVGELEGKTFALSDRPNDVNHPHHYQVLKAIPENVIVVYQPVPNNGIETSGVPGLGGVSPGFHVLMLNEHEGKTIVSCLMEHASLMAEGAAAARMSEEEALGPWRDIGMVPDWLRKWRDDFIPTLKKLIHEGKPGFARKGDGPI